MMKYLRTANRSSLQGIALLRLDFNTKDEWRMEAALTTIKFLARLKVKVLILSHRGRPRGFDESLSLKKDARNLQIFLKQKVQFIPHFRFSAIEKLIHVSDSGSIFLLENLRFLRGEEKNDRKLAKKISRLGDFYVNDAFAVSHRENASVVAITRYMPSYAGLGLEQEVISLSKVFRHPERPLVIILGGSKAHDKLGVLQYFKRKADYFLFGGAAANTLLMLQGFSVKKSLVDDDPRDLKHLKQILKYKNLMLPTDYKFADRMILDIGEHTVRSFVSRIKSARTIIWSGPLGLIEREPYDQGTLDVARAIAKNRRAFSVVGGGETVMFLKKYRLDGRFSFVSTGGGAMLDFLAGEKLPGIEALKRSK